MTSRRLQAVLHNFLGTYTSRYSSYGGYWLFGFLVADLDVLEIELLAVSPALVDGPIGEPPPADAVAQRVAFAAEGEFLRAGMHCMPRDQRSPDDLSAA